MGKCREQHMKQIGLEEARKAGLAPAEVDEQIEDGKEINPHIPQYMSSAPWYLNSEKPSLKHQRKWIPITQSHGMTEVQKPIKPKNTSDEDEEDDDLRFDESKVDTGKYPL